MSRVTDLEKKIEQEERRVLKEKYGLENELEQLNQDKFSYKRKGDYPALDRAVKREREIKKRLNYLDTIVPSLEVELKKAKDDEKRLSDADKRKQEQKQKQQKTKQDMNTVLRYMRQGKNKSQAANATGIPLSRITHWCIEGKQGNGQDAVHFYHEITRIEEDRKIAARREKERKECAERQRRQKERNQKFKVETITSDDRRKMKIVISKMRSGLSKHKAASAAGITIGKFNKWYESGKKGLNADTKYFYEEISKIEAKKSQTTTPSNMIICPDCGNSYNGKSYRQCPHCRKSSKPVPARYCQKCGSPITEDSNYCTKCGKALIESNSANSQSSSKTSVSSNSGGCCPGLFVMFVIIAILILLI